MAANRMSHSQRQVLKILQSRTQISLTDIAAEAFVDSETVRVAIRQLENSGRIRTTRGIGRTPNRYEVLA
jgi:predicted ArsR family transcriptional regulator